MTPLVVPVGGNPTPIWGMNTGERVRRIANMYKLSFADTIAGDGPVLLVNTAFVFDPSWIRHFARHPGQALTLGGVPVIAHCRNETERGEATDAMTSNTSLRADGRLMATAHESGRAMVNEQLRKREQPFALRLEPATVKAAERVSYFGAYKGVTDLLTKYLWPEWALVLTRIAARLGISPNMVTSVGAILCVLATVFFWKGEYWAGMAVGLVFMVLDTVDGKLARCTITSSGWGNIFDHGIDLVHPPFWWIAWGVGLEVYGRPLAPQTFDAVMITILAGYVAQRLIEGAFMRLYGMHIHVWSKLDSNFRLITARRNPNMVILFVCTLFARPDIGLIAIAWWTALSCFFHLIRLIQAMAVHSRGEAIRSWLA